MPLVKPLLRLVTPKLDQPLMFMARDDIRVSPINLAQSVTTVIEMAISKMFAGNYIQKRSQTGAPGARYRVVLSLHMVLPSMTVTCFKKSDCTVLRGNSILACLRCVVGPPFLCLTALCCGAVHSICHLSLLVCAVMRSYSVFARLCCDAELSYLFSSVR